MANLSQLDLLAGLNEQQQEAVRSSDGPIMIIAGAGSGKTRVLVHRLAYMIQQGLADPNELLALTFTNKAGREMRERMEHLIGPRAKHVVMGTFHSIFSRILRVEADKLGYTSNFTIYDEEDAVNLIKSIINELKLDDKKFKPRNVKYNISGAKNHLVTPDTFDRDFAHDEFTQVTAKVYRIYQYRCLQANAMDFDDLLMNMAVLLEKHLDALYKYQRRYKYIMVDEYQDTNVAQYAIIRKMAKEHRNLCVVGDDAQSIYAFRGANIENIFSFQKDFPEAKIVKLEQNYRSTAIIVNAANEVIKHNEKQIPKVIFTQNGRGEPIRLLKGESEQGEAEKIVDTIRELKAVNNYFNKNIAILYRTNAQSRALEDGLRRASIVYKIFGGMSFYKRKEIKDVVAYMRLAVNPTDEEAIRRVINYPLRGIGATSVEKLMAMAQINQTSLWHIVRHAVELKVGRSAIAVQQFATLVESYGYIVAQQDAYQVVKHIASTSGILQDLHKDKSVEGLSRWENVQELINAAQAFCNEPEREDYSMTAFLAEIALFTDQDQKIENDDYVSLMTIHASKGLEFPVVFIAGLEEGLFPSVMAMQDKADIEEERRLFYVALTRAKERLSISYAKSRYRYGSIEFQEPSRFLDEISNEYFVSASRLKADAPPLMGASSKPPTSRLISLRQNPTLLDTTPTEFVSDDLTGLQVGAKVEHNKFGIGIVQEIEGKGANARAVIEFVHKGAKTIILKYAKLKILG
jgi:DNA helicase II / ATP-dependent DNA helicase PcrA